jgi:hypothetical protein
MKAMQGLGAGRADECLLVGKSGRNELPAEAKGVKLPRPFLAPQLSSLRCRACPVVMPTLVTKTTGSALSSRPPNVVLSLAPDTFDIQLSGTDYTRSRHLVSHIVNIATIKAYL